MLILLCLGSLRSEGMRAYFDMVMVLVDHANKLAEVPRVGRQRKAEDGINFLCLRLDFIGNDDMAKVFKLLGKETFPGPDREIIAIQMFEASFYVFFHVIYESTASKDSDIIDETFDIGQITK